MLSTACLIDYLSSKALRELIIDHKAVFCCFPFSFSISHPTWGETQGASVRQFWRCSCGYISFFFFAFCHFCYGPNAKYNSHVILVLGHFACDLWSKKSSMSSIFLLIGSFYFQPSPAISGYSVLSPTGMTYFTISFLT